MTHKATPRFWRCYQQLPEDIRRLADASYEVLRNDPRHPSLHLKKVGRFWSVRIGLRYRALAVEDGEVLVWFWVGTHAEYDRLVSR